MHTGEQLPAPPACGLRRTACRYEVHCGKAHMVQGAWGKALEQLRSVGKHFEDIREDQFDFHSYCLRKLTLRAYVHMLRMQDSLYSHPSYSKVMPACMHASRIFAYHYCDTCPAVCLPASLPSKATPHH
jgi:hypothetical protein